MSEHIGADTVEGGCRGEPDGDVRTKEEQVKIVTGCALQLAEWTEFVMPHIRQGHQSCRNCWQPSSGAKQQGST